MFTHIRFLKISMLYGSIRYKIDYAVSKREFICLNVYVCEDYKVHFTRNKDLFKDIVYLRPYYYCTQQFMNNYWTLAVLLIIYFIKFYFQIC